VSILFVTPRDDRSSRQCAKWADALMQAFQGAADDLPGTSRAKLDKELSSHQHVVYFGHGERDALIVPPGLLRKKVVLAEESNLTGTADRVVVAVACWSSDDLAGRVTAAAAPASPVRSYIGWLDDISWPDDWPDPIGDAVVEGLTELLRGGTTADCVAALKRAFDDAHDTYRTTGPSRMASDRVAFGKMCALYWKARLDLRGDGNATL
jgi:hypothetical protein